jgi:hypothetical protein
MDISGTHQRLDDLVLGLELIFADRAVIEGPSVAVTALTH